MIPTRTTALPLALALSLAAATATAGGAPDAGQPVPEGEALRAPVPANAYISRDGLDWAWAAPVPAPLAGMELGRVAPDGWRLPTPAELTRAPAPVDFVFPGANVPLDGQDAASGARFLMPGPGLEGAAACAAPWFGAWRHCDWVDGEGVFGQAWAGRDGQSRYSEQLMVRDSRLPEVPLAAAPAAPRG
ncbi:hypothetical protein P2H44_07270 [Albimonas sp. CAU 1670]|uniref:hypothetical protein n=1 Tax=Albimonas sp. CAU 1670 TaxID=3032599 RepID=UPI0023DA749D|nr:hypothetical protein [Albimonas sp. CAU 1670]MDF2232354.1 hypothetical protein [Albimonas sp. CAU 1670]